MFKGFKKKNNHDDMDIPANYEFNHAMEIVKVWLNQEEETQGKVNLINFVMGVIREDLKTDILTTILYSQKHFRKDLPSLIFPYHYYDEKGTQLRSYDKESPEREISLQNDCVLVMPWNRSRLRNSITHLANHNFEYKPNNHDAEYFTEIDVCYASNGRHSIGAGVGHKKGEIIAKEIDVSKLYNHVYTDGEYWYNSHTKEKYSNRYGYLKVFDFRIAILYELAKIKHQIRG